MLIPGLYFIACLVCVYFFQEANMAIALYETTVIFVFGSFLAFILVNQ
jgi:hypothetical protein